MSQKPNNMHDPLKGLNKTEERKKLDEIYSEIVSSEGGKKINPFQLLFDIIKLIGWTVYTPNWDKSKGKPLDGMIIGKGSYCQDMYDKLEWRDRKMGAKEIDKMWKNNEKGGK